VVSSLAKRVLDTDAPPFLFLLIFRVPKRTVDCFKLLIAYTSYVALIPGFLSCWGLFCVAHASLPLPAVGFQVPNSIPLAADDELNLMEEPLGTAPEWDFLGGDFSPAPGPAGLCYSTLPQ
jgi:hypothetical protein